eukprot:CAMPEP_0183349158 /NCGR_PEP_ID=MMETSP0164_2-20130417/13429_1 /TAXON_ID=221442 /ORGANISM="Coccolithus pelagicus ssp braarudi, Strain PLY182g" /LENGTH=230 /DNA_ID=CAMNT_0025520839 /DNA_START=27 /DNA_END=720 /DNA_ORIENTATION=+
MRDINCVSRDACFARAPRTPVHHVTCCLPIDGAELRARCLENGPALLLDEHARERVAQYIDELLLYNEHTNVYSKRAYTHLPFHVHDSLTLGLIIAEASAKGSAVLDLGSGSGLPSVLIAAVNPSMPVYAIESKSRKTRFLSRVAASLPLPNYLPLTCNVHEFARSSYFDADFVTAKAFKPLDEVVPIAEVCLRKRALLHVPVSEIQVRHLALAESQLYRRGKYNITDKK